MERALQDAIAAMLGAPVESVRAISGGDINEAYGLELTGGAKVFVKTHRAAPAAMFEAEARGLKWLADADALPVPRVLAVSDTPQPWLALEHIAPGKKAPDFDEQLGRGLAKLHRAGAPSFGLDHGNYIGSLEQDNRPCSSWDDFYRARRLEPQIRMASNQGLIRGTLGEELSRLLDQLERWTGQPEPAARLHGDLWGGNSMTDEHGNPCLIDPAVYGGHREMDLAMMRLFGGFSSAVFTAYDEQWPLAEGFEERVPLWQLYPLLVHVNLFGGVYVSQLQRAVSRYV